jgi:hypothetical protein
MRTTLKKYKSFHSLKAVTKRKQSPASIEFPIVFEELNSFFQKLQTSRKPAINSTSKQSAHRNSR